MVNRPNNREVVVFAIAALGGESQFIHTEDVAIKCHELAPDAFSWTKYTEHPDLEVARRTLLNIRSEGLGALVEGRSGQGPRKKGTQAEDGWRLTEAGREWISVNGERVEAGLNSTALSDRRQRVRQQLRRIYLHPTWPAFKDNPNGFEPTIGDLAELMRVRVDAPSGVWAARFDELLGRATLIQDEALVDFTKRCRSIYGTAK